MTAPPIPTAFRALRHRNFRLFIAGELVSITGGWAQQTAQAWLVVTLVGTGNAALFLGLVVALQVLPVLVVGLVGGIVADVVPKRRTLAATQTAAGLLAISIGVLVYTDAIQVWHVLLAAVALGFVNSIDMPTRQVFVVEMVGAEDVASALTLNSAAFNVARIVGPSIGGLLIAVVGVSACFFLNGLSFAAVVVSLLAVRDSELLRADRLVMPKSIREAADHLAEGLRYVRGTPLVLLAIVAGGLASALGMSFNVMVPAMAASVLNVGPTGFGLLNAAIGLGAVLVSLPVASLRRPTLRPLLAGIAVLGVSLMGFAVSPSFDVAMATIAVAGGAGLVLVVGANSLVQTASPAQLRGRVMSVFTIAFVGATPAGNLLFGVIAQLAGTRIAVLFAGSATLLVGLIAGMLVLAGRVREATPETALGTDPEA